MGVFGWHRGLTRKEPPYANTCHLKVAISVGGRKAGVEIRDQPGHHLYRLMRQQLPLQVDAIQHAQLGEICASPCISHRLPPDHSITVDIKPSDEYERAMLFLLSNSSAFTFDARLDKGREMHTAALIPRHGPTDKANFLLWSWQGKRGQITERPGQPPPLTFVDSTSVHDTSEVDTFGHSSFEVPEGLRAGLSNRV